ncbi:MAG TPA: gluconokinase [Pyrinomonadaceae bacterium]|nr:gluconokinase [Pyrinomonadaceae bacterium]
MSTIFDEAVLEDRPEIDLSVLRSLSTEPEEIALLAIDIGSSGTRAALFNGRGEQLEGSMVTVPNASLSSLISGDDLDPDLLFASVIRAIDLAVERAELFVSRIDYVAMSCFWHSLVGVDEQENAITPLLGWADRRAAQPAVELREQLDESIWHARTGCRFHPSYWPAKLIWLARARSEAFNRTRHWLSFSDYLYLRLFGNPTTSVSMASATGLFDQHNCEWDSELLAKLAVGPHQLPPVASQQETLQELRDDYRLRWPILDRAAWFPAIGDGAANNIGLGSITRDRVALMLGTSGAMRMLSSWAAPQILPPELFCYRADRERVVIGGALSDGGSAVARVKDELGLKYDAEELDQLIDLLEPDAHGLTILPFWSGERAPGWSTAAEGAIEGLTAQTQPIEIVRAVMEAICYRFALIDRVLDLFAPEASIILTGKIFLSHPVWAQMMADVLGKQLEVFPAAEATIRGAALLALETIGKIEGIELIKSEAGRVYLPDRNRQEVYARGLERQERLYHQLIT